MGSDIGIRGSGEGARVLEIGSGYGAFAAFCVRWYPKTSYVGLELSELGIATASTRIPAARFIQRDLLKPPVSKEGFDFRATHAVCSEVVEHVDDPVLLLRNATAYMGLQCKLIVTVPGGPVTAFQRYIGHRQHYTGDRLRTLLETAGFSVDSAHGTGFAFYNLYMMAVAVRGERLVTQVSGHRRLRCAPPVFFSILFFTSIPAVADTRLSAQRHCAVSERRIELIELSRYTTAGPISSAASPLYNSALRIKDGIVVQPVIAEFWFFF